ncbi:MAG: kelch repeat-containing protein [Promethearchaeia archaeon]
MYWDFGLRWLVVFGGSTGVKLLACTWEFDLETERWRSIRHPGTVMPTSRYGHTLTYIKHKREILLFGILA